MPSVWPLHLATQAWFAQCSSLKSRLTLCWTMIWVLIAILLMPQPARAIVIGPHAAAAFLIGPPPGGLEAQFIPTPPGFPTQDAQAIRIHVPWSRTFEICLGIVIVALVPCFIEWRWMASRQEYLRSMVFERTRELEAEKAELLKTKAALVQLASRDSLTGIFNRAAIMDLLEQEILRAKRERTSIAIVLADLDNFKRVNDIHGHLAGDEVLREFSRRLQAGVRLGDYIGRYGGEEILILLRCLPDGSGGRVAELHRKVNQSPYMLSGNPLSVTSSFGALWFTAPMTAGATDSVDSLLNLADQALYRAKANGRNQVQMAPSHLLGPVPVDSLTHPLTA